MCTLFRTQGLSGVKLGGGVTVQAPIGEETEMEVLFFPMLQAPYAS